MNRKITIITILIVVFVSIFIVLLVGVKEKRKKIPTAPTKIELSEKSKQNLIKYDNFQREEDEDKIPKLGEAYKWFMHIAKHKEKITNDLEMIYKYQTDLIQEDANHFEIYEKGRLIGNTKDGKKLYQSDYFNISVDLKKQKIKIHVKKDIKNEIVELSFKNSHNKLIEIKISINGFN